MFLGQMKICSLGPAWQPFPIWIEGPWVSSGKQEVTHPQTMGFGWDIIMTPTLAYLHPVAKINDSEMAQFNLSQWEPVLRFCWKYWEEEVFLSKRGRRVGGMKTGVASSNSALNDEGRLRMRPTQRKADMKIMNQSQVTWTEIWNQPHLKPTPIFFKYINQ